MMDAEPATQWKSGLPRVAAITAAAFAGAWLLTRHFDHFGSLHYALLLRADEAYDAPPKQQLADMSA